MRISDLSLNAYFLAQDDNVGYNDNDYQQHRILEHLERWWSFRMPAMQGFISCMLGKGVVYMLNSDGL